MYCNGKGLLIIKNDQVVDYQTINEKSILKVNKCVGKELYININEKTCESGK